MGHEWVGSEPWVGSDAWPSVDYELGPEVTSANPYADIDTSQMEPGVWQYEVRYSDGESWTDFSSESATFTIEPTLNVLAGAATSASSPPSLEPTARIPAATSTADGAAPGYSNGVDLGVLAATASARTTTPWSHLEEYSGTDPFADTELLAIGNLQYQVRVADAEGWGLWSSEYAAVLGKIATNLWILLDDGVWHQVQRWVRWDPNWVRHKSQLL